MRLITAAMLTRMKANASLTALLGNRIFPLAARQDTPLPYAVYDADYTPEYDIGGNAVGLSQMEYTLTVYTDGDTAVKDGLAIVDEIRNSLDGFRGSVNVTVGVDVTSVSIRTCILTGGVASTYVPPIDGGEVGRCVHIMQFSVGYFEPQPTASTV